MEDISKHLDFITREVLRTSRLGFHNPWRRHIYVNRKHEGCLWYFWNGTTHEPILMTALTGFIIGLREETTTYKDKAVPKICIDIDADERYTLVAGADTVFVKSILRALSIVPKSAFSRPLTVAVSPGEEESVIFGTIINPFNGRSVFYDEQTRTENDGVIKARAFTLVNGADYEPDEDEPYEDDELDDEDEPYEDDDDLDDEDDLDDDDDTLTVEEQDKLRTTAYKHGFSAAGLLAYAKAVDFEGGPASDLSELPGYGYDDYLRDVSRPLYATRWNLQGTLTDAAKAKKATPTRLNRFLTMAGKVAKLVGKGDTFVEEYTFFTSQERTKDPAELCATEVDTAIAVMAKYLTSHTPAK